MKFLVRSLAGVFYRHQQQKWLASCTVRANAGGELSMHGLHAWRGAKNRSAIHALAIKGISAMVLGSRHVCRLAC